MKKLALSLTILGLSACQQQAAAPAAAPAATPAAAPSAQQQAVHAAAPAAAPAEGSGHEGCAAHAAIAHPESATATDASGATVTVTGTKLAGLAAVSIAELLARPEQYAGKSVRVEGSVSAMCYHRRGWFAVQEGGSGGSFVRVVTAPTFLVPEGAMGKQVRTEGVVEVTEVAEGTARHYAKDHKLGDPSAVQGPVKAVILRATGAEFI